jgi:hypothetical protein
LIVFGITLRAIGRGLGNGTFALAEARAEIPDNPTASARLVANAVDRNAAVRTKGDTAFLGGESFNRLAASFSRLKMWIKYLYAGASPHPLHHHSGKIAAFRRSGGLSPDHETRYE